MPYFQLSPDGVSFLTVAGPTITVDEIVYVVASFDLWSDTELFAIGIVRPTPSTDVVPDGKRVTGIHYERQGDAVVAVADLGDLLPAPPPPPPPSLASKLQIYKAAKQLGKWDAIQAALDGNPEAKIEWDLASFIRRDDALTQGLAAAAGWTSDDLQGLFTLADTFT